MKAILLGALMERKHATDTSSLCQSSVNSEEHLGCPSGRREGSATGVRKMLSLPTSDSHQS